MLTSTNPETVKEVMRFLGKRGGRASGAKRKGNSEVMRQLSLKRWAKAKAKARAGK